jgi:hypothetical protein
MVARTNPVPFLIWSVRLIASAEKNWFGFSSSVLRDYPGRAVDAQS